MYSSPPMPKVIAAINLTLDGVCDHTVGIADEELHRHYEELIDNAGVILYGRTTYQLMQYWQSLLQDPSDEPSMNDFAESIDRVPKLVFSSTLASTGWDSARLAQHSLEKEIAFLKRQPGKDILVGSRSLIIQLLNLNLIDELQLCFHPIIEGKGLRLFEHIDASITLNRTGTKLFKSGVTLLYFEPIRR